MRWVPTVVCAVCVLGQLASAIPVPDALAQQSQLPLNVQESLRTLQLEETGPQEVTRNKRTIALLRSLFPHLSQTEINPEENQLSGAESQQNEVRVPYMGDQQAAYGESDQELAASGGNDAPDLAIAETAVEDDAEDADARSKRQFSLGGGSGSGGGSGNFLFDIIRLIAGSGNTEASSDQSASLDASGTVEKDDGYQAGIPGPITRLFVIANRGIANLVQDLILRLAQTSERIVNFKARLITSII